MIVVVIVVVIVADVEKMSSCGKNKFCDEIKSNCTHYMCTHGMLSFV